MDSGFFQIPHWLPSGSGLAIFLVHKVQGEFLRAPLPSPTCSPLPRATVGLAPTSRLACRSHITTARALRRAAASRHDPYANGFTASRMRSACCLRGSGTSAPAPLRQHARAYAYRGLRALASLSMARSGRRGPVRVVPEAIAETGLRLVGDPYGFVLARPPRDCRPGSSNQGRPTRLAICDFPQNPFLYAGSSNSDDQEPRLSVGPHRHRHQAPSPGASPQTAP